jgi:hypothetical protein
MMAALAIVLVFVTVLPLAWLIFCVIYAEVWANEGRKPRPTQTQINEGDPCQFAAPGAELRIEHLARCDRPRSG